MIVYTSYMHDRSLLGTGILINSGGPF